jgi:mannose-6-phosphate isomerase-like protein (cupin superfamily)
MDRINLEEKLASFDELWSPKIVTRFNDHDVMVGKVKGEFVWHKHDETDDFFLVLKGRLTIQLRDGDIELDEGDMFVVPQGVEHCPKADEEAHILVIEPEGMPNTGDAGGPMTAEKERI